MAESAAKREQIAQLLKLEERFKPTTLIVDAIPGERAKVWICLKCGALVAEPLRASHLLTHGGLG
jgi:rubrerythrin